MDLRPRCTKCNRVIRTDYGDGICSYCRKEKRVKKTITLCPICGRRMYRLNKDGYVREYCSVCEKNQFGSTKTVKRNLSQKAPKLSGKAVDRNLRSYAKQDAKNRQQGKHISYGMYMAMRAAEIKEGKK